MKRLMKEAAGVLLFDEPEACAKLKGSEKYPSIQGKVFFYSFWQGTLIAAMVTGLPFTVGDCSGRFFGFHLHEGDTHYNPEGCSHPMHAGDFPVLPGNNGCALMFFYTERFHPEQAVGKTVVIHEMSDDFHTQPSGNPGDKIATGEVLLSADC